MSGITEVYVCKFGERLEDGALQTTTEIASRDDAERDAEAMCQRDPTIDRIAYYSVKDDGNHRHLLTYTNPTNPRRAQREPNPPTPRPALRTRKRAAPTFWQRILAMFG